MMAELKYSQGGEKNGCNCEMMVVFTNLMAGISSQWRGWETFGILFELRTAWKF